MNIKKLIQRLLVFFIGVPLVLFIAAFPWQKHLILHVAILITSGVAAFEMYGLLKNSSSMHSKWLLIILDVLIPLSAFMCVFFNLPNELITFVFITVFLILISLEIFAPNLYKTSVSAENDNLFFGSNSRMASSVLLELYCGFLITFISRMTDWQYSTNYIIIFLLMVFMCDSFAWLFGVLFGKGTRGVFKASPNKSIVGFIFGILGSMLSGFVGYLLWPDAFPSLSKTIFLGACVSIAAIIGDLVESVIKRSAHCKDSGNIILGRGGILDSIDSIVMAAPIYYFLVVLLYGI